MSTPTTVELAAWIEDALDPDRADEIRRLIEASPALGAQVAALKMRLADPWVPPPPRWSLPLPALRMPGAPRADVRAVYVMGSLTGGARFEVRLDEPPDPTRLRLVVLTRRDRDWDVIFPTAPDEDVPVAALPAAKGGGRIVGLVAHEGGGTQRWALVYADRAMGIDWDAPSDTRWAPLRLALEQGLAVAAVVERSVIARR